MNRDPVLPVIIRKSSNYGREKHRSHMAPLPGVALVMSFVTLHPVHLREFGQRWRAIGSLAIYRPGEWGKCNRFKQFGISRSSCFAEFPAHRETHTCTEEQNRSEEHTSELQSP